MSKKPLLLTILSFLLALPLVAANVAYPIGWITLPLLPFIVLIEGFMLWLLAKKWLKAKLGFWMSILVVLIANFITSLLGTFISLFMYGTWVEDSLFFTLAFIASVIIEWGIFVFLFKQMKSLRKLKIKNKQLFLISLYVNIASYLPLMIFFSGW